MKIRFKKTMKIASELLSYCHSIGGREYNLNISEEEELLTFVITSSPAEVGEREMERLRTSLNAPRQREIEQDYWELIGESASHSELTLLGMLCDDAIVDYRNKVLTITLKRHD